VSLNISSTKDRVLIEVQDQCGGLPPGTVNDFFRPFSQRGSNRRGHRRRDPGARRAGTGCVFAIDLPMAFGGP
jgi:hypothetical protein